MIGREIDPVKTPAAQPTREDNPRGTVRALVYGLAICALGAICIAAASSADDPNTGLAARQFGYVLVWAGAIVSGLAVLVELFSIRPALARLHAAGANASPSQPEPPSAAI